MENYVLYEELGRGSYSVVYKGRKKGSVEYVAVHCAEKIKRRELQNIVRLTHELDHPNIVKFCEWYETTNHIWMVVELCTGQNLKVMLEQDGCLPEVTVRTFGVDIMSGLRYLHTLGILYCDLRCTKLILDGCGTVKLGNFCLAKVDGEEEFFEMEEIDDNEGEYRRPSPIYMAPEVLKGQPHSIESDIWSLGCVLYELFTGNPPFEADAFAELVAKVITENFYYPLQTLEAVEVGPSDEFYSLLQSLLSKDVSVRCSWDELTLHPFWEGAFECTAQNEVDNLDERERTGGIPPDEKEMVTEQKQDDTLFEKPDAPKTVVARKSSMESRIPVKKRPVSAPGIKQGTYRLDEVRPRTTESELGKTKKVIRDEKQLKPPILGKQSSTSKQNWSFLDDQRSKDQTQVKTSDTNEVSSVVQNIVSGGDLDIEKLLYHPSDFTISAILDNPNIKKLVIPKWDGKALGVITPFTVEELLEQDKDVLVQYFTEISEIFQQGQQTPRTSAGQRCKLHLSSYLGTIVQNTEVANMVANSDVVPSMLQLMKQTASVDLKARLGLTLGILASNATLIADKFAMNEAFVVLTETIRDNFRNAKLKQSLLPCLGEFVFYAATQEETEGRIIESWEVPGVTFTIIAKCLRTGEDSVVQHYAAKTIQNIATTNSQHCEKFATNETAQMLWNLFTHSSGDSQKLTAISALCRLTRHTVSLFQHVVDNAGLHTVLNNLVSGVTKVQQAIITMLAALVSKGVHTKRLVEDKEFTHKMMQFLDSPSIIIRGKAFVAVAAMSREHHIALLHCCQYKLVTYIERDNKRQTPVKTDNAALQGYLKDCLQLCVKTVYQCVPQIVQSLILALEAVTGRRHPSAAQSKELRTCIPLLSIVLHLVTSHVFRLSIVDETFVRRMGQLAAHVTCIDSGVTNIVQTGLSGTDDLTNVVLSIIEAIAQHPVLLLEHRRLVVENVLPHLAELTSSASGDVRMFCFKMFADMASVFLESETMDEGASPSAQLLTSVITSKLLPQYDTILQDQDPLPSYGLKLLLAFLEHSPQCSEAIVEKGIVESLGDILERHDGDVGGPVVQTIISLLDCLVSSLGANLWPLYEQGLIDHVTSLFVSASALINEKNIEKNFSEILLPLLDTVHGIMKYSSKAVREALQATSTGDESADTITKNAEAILLEGKPLVELTGVLIQFLCHADTDIQDWSLRCLYQVIELYGGTYEDAMSSENQECLAKALLAFDAKKQKQVLRVVKRLVSSNIWHAAVLKDKGDVLLEAMVEVTKRQESADETAAIKELVVEITKATGIA